MGFIVRHIKSFILAFAASLALAGGMPAYSQQLIIPERWKKAMLSVKPLYSPDTLTIRVLGDIMMHEKQIITASKSDGTYDFNTYFMFIEDEIKTADIAVANMEFTLAGKPYTGYPCFSAPDQFPEYLSDCGFDIFLAANNHIFDKGTSGAERTIESYRSLSNTKGIKFTGLAGTKEEILDNNPLIYRVKGIRLAIMNLTYGTNMGLQTFWPKTNYMSERQKAEDAFRTAEENGADFTLVFPHWGKEYVLKHSESQGRDAEWLVENGADMIIGAHPHVIQDMEKIDDVHVIYSLGNAVSNMSATNTQLELMATIRIVRNGNGDFVILAPEMTYLWCSRPGGFNDSYTVIPVKRFLGRKAEWKNTADYDKMTATYERVKKETNIND